MKNDDALKLILILMTANYLEALQEQLKNNDYHEYPLLDDEFCALLDTVYTYTEDMRDMLQDYIESTGLDKTLNNLINGKNEE